MSYFMDKTMFKKGSKIMEYFHVTISLDVLTVTQKSL